METHLSPKQVADALGVSESSVKRWCDSGVIPSEKTVGGHRRIPVDGLMMFLQRTNRRLMDPSAIGMVARSQDGEGLVEGVGETGGLDWEEQGEHFYRALVQGDMATCRRIVLHWYRSGRGMASIADDLIAVTMHRVGIDWSCNEVDIYQERRGCEICSGLIQELRWLVAEPTAEAPLALGASPAGDPYTLPGQLIELVMREAGWRASNLGSNIPFSSLLKAVQQVKPRFVWLSVSTVGDSEAFVEECNRFAERLPRDVVLVVGGRALHDAIRPRLKFTAHCDTLHHLTSFASSVRGYRPAWTNSAN